MPQDLNDLRIGHGYDIHRLQPKGRLVLAGVEVAEGISPLAHSDGDVILHAVVDALLGAAGLGDIGEMFPNTDPRWKDAASQVFVDGAMQRVREMGFTPVNVDVTVLAERPKLKTHKSKMVQSLSKMVGCPVNVKAGTNEGCDAVGRGEAIAAHAVVLLARTVDGTMDRTKP
ncbi:MAG TPA: 2-C-methyl-D-erythritol 2,4-cyclodiphosphate synthase [Tepidisphaeraceae bacterium]|jgi:2-C-methyl-D-erythritol 2,4-cyclodiphosphate synthase|nr:2-C-methyl-D-erythritol 2,4-cyclodiphosphate synthase [Tepidisphaeraceae bacterium]